MESEAPTQNLEQTQEETNKIDEGFSLPKFFTTKTVGMLMIVLGSALVLGVLFSFWALNQVDVIDAPIMEPIREEIITQETTADWNVYENLDNNFKIEYPIGWDNWYKGEGMEGTKVISFFEKTEDEPALYRVEITIYPLEDGLAAMRTDTLSETNIYTFKNDKVFQFKLVSEYEEDLTFEIKQTYYEIFTKMLESFETISIPGKKAECRATGCSGHVCAEKELITTCEYLEIYDCYKTAVCERQKNGQCGWTVTSELKACLRQSVGAEVEESSQ